VVGKKSSSPERAEQTDRAGLSSSSLARRASTAIAGFQNHLHQLAPGRKALIAVSGGRDSVALLHFLASSGWRKLVVVHLNHGLRGRISNADAKFVRKLAGKLGVRCEIKKFDVAPFAKKKRLSIETAGREARREFFAVMARKHRCKFLFTAHHADDQAETVLHRLCRGASLRGAAGMSGVAESIPGLITLRPLLAVTRDEIDRYLDAHQLRYRDDASNNSPAHTRNRVRHELLPLMNRVFGRDVRPLLGRFAELAERDERYLAELACDFAVRRGLHESNGSLRISALRGGPPAIVSRIVHQWLSRQKISNVGSRQIEAALDLMRDSGPLKANLPGNVHLCRDGRRLWLEPPSISAKGRTQRRRPSKLQK
jgi:tRNA(Ile)-lysidine synthase